MLVNCDILRKSSLSPSNSSSKTLSAWYAKQLSPYGNGSTEDGCHPDEAQALKEYLDGQSTARDAAYRITRPAATSKDPDGTVYRPWGLLSDALMECPETEIAKIAALLKAIQDLAETEPIAAAAPLWPRLRWFGSGWGDILRKMDWREHLEDRKPFNQPTWALQKARQAKVEATLAIHDIGCTPLCWGFMDIRDALESSKAVLHIELPLVAEWFDIAGSQLRDAALAGEAVWETAVPCDLWRDEDVLSARRWALWQSRVEGLVKGDLGEVARAAAQRILAFFERERTELTQTSHI